MKFKKPMNYVVGIVAILTCVLLFSSLSGAASKSDGTIGIVDMNKLQENLPDFQQLQALVKDKDAEFKLFQNYVYMQHQNALKAIKEKADKEKDGKSADQQAKIDSKYNEEIQKRPMKLEINWNKSAMNS
jgi:Skp family chaperone for outer membrane proteins